MGPKAGLKLIEFRFRFSLFQWVRQHINYTHLPDRPCGSLSQKTSVLNWEHRNYLWFVKAGSCFSVNKWVLCWVLYMVIKVDHLGQPVELGSELCIATDVVVTRKRYSMGLLSDGCVKSPDYRENIHRALRSVEFVFSISSVKSSSTQHDDQFVNYGAI